MRGLTDHSARVAVLAAVSLVWGSPAAAAPLVVDDFESGALDEPAFPGGTIRDDTADGAWVMTGRAGLAPPHVLFTRRFVGANVTTGAAADARLAPDPFDAADDAVTFEVAAGASARFMVGYDGGAADLTDSGAGDRFLVSLTGDATGGTMLLGAGATIDGGFRTVEPVTLPLIGPGEYAIPFSSLLPRNPQYPTAQILAAAMGLEIQFDGVTASAAAPRVFGVSQLIVVPEPAASSLLAVGCAAMLHRRRR